MGEAVFFPPAAPPPFEKGAGRGKWEDGLENTPADSPSGWWRFTASMSVTAVRAARRIFDHYAEL